MENHTSYPTTITLDEEQTAALLCWLNGHRAEDIKDGLEDLGDLRPLLRLLDFQIKTKAKFCLECGAEIFKTYYHNSSWVSVGNITYALHLPREIPAVILTTDGWHCLKCKYTWKDAQSSRLSPTTARENNGEN